MKKEKASGHLKLFFAVAIALALSGAPAPAYPEMVDRVAAVVNDGIITLSELDAAIAVISGGLKREDAPKESKTTDVGSSALDGLIEKMLMKQAAERAGIEVSEREIDNAVEDIKKQNNITHETLMILLVQNGLTYAQYRNQLREDIRQVKFVNQQFRSRISIEDEEVEEYYRQNAERFFIPRSYRLKVLHLKNVEEGLLETRLGAVEEGIKNGRDFSELVKEYSDGPEVANGGDIGYVKTGELSPQVEEAAKKMKKGEISPPINAPDGIYIIQLLDFKEGAPAPLETVKDNIKNILHQKIIEERYNFWLSEMKRLSHIEIRL